MTDRELLERAAKAAGFKVLRASDGSMRDCTDMHPSQNIFAASTWNPLEDDGDALRLAVKLHIQVISLPNGMSQAIWSTDTPSGFVVRNETHCDCPFAATRRAIVRAAAAMSEDV